MIEFEIPKPIAKQRFLLQTVAEEMMRPHSRYFDEHEHEIPWDYINFMHQAMRAMGAGALVPSEQGNGKDEPVATNPLLLCSKSFPGEMLACTW